ncbi:HNH endonuclease signature motif containing protein [Prosthecobacter sp.]|uniref:HNH endonuclease n=1 Tax=Prosthecobacter sp. TaxID=1965333 RepID=UPI002AB94B91|nr:HNH endonuclease signature motif containing protein [Prosthecobacter sp.]MDZ4406265.1 HNH endonuclease signature motif containing protein [Prosthecobacter sp.]
MPKTAKRPRPKIGKAGAKAKAKPKSKTPHPFSFPAKPYRRIHGPQGHSDYVAYKPWLRDEFEFRCVYCLTRERWGPEAHNRFSIDHVKPKSLHQDLTCDYDNLIYACIRCNTLKSTMLGLPDPCKVSLASHLKLNLRSGRFLALTGQGEQLIEYLRLNAQDRVDDRCFHLLIFQSIDPRIRKALPLKFGYPPDLPDLSKLRPPQGNSRPEGVMMSHFARYHRKELPLYY